MTKHFRYRYSPIWALWKAYVRETHPKNSLVRRSSLVPAFLVAPGFHSIVQIYGLKGPQKRQAKLCSNFLEEPVRFSTPRPRSSFGSYTMLLSSFGLFFYFCTDRKVGLVLAFLWSLSWVASQLSSMPLPVLLECSVPWGPEEIFRWNHFFSGRFDGEMRDAGDTDRENENFEWLCTTRFLHGNMTYMTWCLMIYNDLYICVCVCVDALSIASGFDVANISTINSLSLRWTRLQLNPPGYYCTGRSVKILRAVVRLGKDDAGQAIVFMFYFLLSTIYWMLFVWLIFFRCFPDGRWFSEMSTLLAGSHL